MKHKIIPLVSLLAVLLLLAVLTPAALAEDTGEFVPRTLWGGDGIVIFSRSEFHIEVVDFAGKPIEGAIVTFRDHDPLYEGGVETVATDSDGHVKVPHLVDWFAKVEVSVSKDGYKFLHKDPENYRDRHMVIQLEKINPEPLVLRYADCTRGIDLLNLETTDVTSGVMQFNCKASDAAVIDPCPRKFDLVCAANDTDAAIRYTIYQGGKQIASSENGKFENLNAADFVPDVDVYVKTEGHDGNYAVTKLKLKFYAINLASEYASFGLDKFTITVSDKVPYLGGSKLVIDLPFKCPVTFAVSDKKIMFGVGVSREGPDETRIQKLQEAKALMGEVAGLTATAINNSGLTEAQSNKLKELTTASNGTSTAFDGGVANFFKSIQARVIGYGELDFDGTSEANLEKISGNILIQLNIPLVNGSWTTWVGVVPVTASLNISAGMNTTVDFTYDFTKTQFTVDCKIQPYASLNAFGGVGIGKVAAVGAYGIATLDGVIDSKPEWHVQSVSLTGELGLKAYVWIFSYQKTFAKDTWKIYTNPDFEPRGINGANDAGAYFNALLGMSDFSQYQEESLAYLKNEGAWISERDDLVPRGEDAAASFTNLISGTYRNAQPVMVSTNGNLYAAFIQADETTGEVYTVVAKYEDGQWSDRVKTQTGAVMDSEPRLVVSGDTIYLSYLRMPSELTRQALAAQDREAQVLAYATNQQLVVGHLNPETLTFMEDKVFQCDGFLHSYTISATDDSVTVAWFESEVNDGNSVLLHTESVLRTATRTANGWSEARDVTAVSGDVGDIILGERNGETLIAYTVNHPVAETEDTENVEAAETAENIDNTLTFKNTTASLYVIGSNGNTECITEECDGKVTFARLPGTEQSDFVWNDDEKLVNTAGESITVANINGTYVILDNSIYYAASGDSCSNLTAMHFVDGEWTSAIEMITDEAYLEDLSVVNLNGETYVLGMNAMVDILEGDQLEDSKDIVFVKLSVVSDLLLADILCDRGSLVAGEDTTVDLYVINQGDHAVNSVEIWMDDEYLETREVTIPVNTTNVIPVTLRCPSRETTYSFEVRETGANQHCTGKNIWNITLGHADLAVSLSVHDYGTKKELITYWRNDGLSEMGGKLQLFVSDGEETKLIFEVDDPDLILYPGEVFIHKEIADEIQRSGSKLTFTAVITPSGNDSDLYNNRAAVTVTFDAKYVNYENMMTLPDSTVTIEDEAFANCAFEAVETNEALESIGALAFADSKELKQVRLGYKVSNIAYDAFSGCPEVILWCPYGSYAAEYAHQQGISYRLY